MPGADPDRLCLLPDGAFGPFRFPRAGDGRVQGWRGLKGQNQLLKVVNDIKFKDGIETPAEIKSAASSSPSPIFPRSSASRRPDVQKCSGGRNIRRGSVR
jgi:hypothetical protein